MKRYIDITAGMFTPEGKPDPKYLRTDMLHPSAEGYALMAAAIRRRLVADGLADAPETPR